LEVIRNIEMHILTTEGCNDIKLKLGVCQMDEVVCSCFLSVVLTGVVCPAPFDKHDLLLSTFSKLAFVQCWVCSNPYTFQGVGYYVGSVLLC
jgi:hypothetical protein